MGLRIGEDESYKFHPPLPAQRTRSRRKHLSSRRKNESTDQSYRSHKSAASELKGFMMHIRSGTTSTQTSTQPSTQTSTNCHSSESTPRASIGSRPGSRASFAPSMASETDDGHLKKWWLNRGRKTREPNKNGRATPAPAARPINLDLWQGKEHKRVAEPDHGKDQLCVVMLYPLTALSANRTIVEYIWTI